MANILIITSRTGGGHMNLALSLKDMLGARFSIDIVDPFPPVVDRYYAGLSRDFLTLWDWQYKYTDNEFASLWLHKGLALLSQKRLTSLIEQAAPQLIVSTHALLSYVVASANRQTGMRIPLAFQLTDLECVHSTWFSEKFADAYLTPTREIFAQARARGIEQGRLHITGRPVRKQFLQTYDSACRTETLTRLGLSPEAFTVFLQGGAKGSARIERTISSIFAAGSASAPIQIILAAGTNNTIISRFSALSNLRVIERYNLGWTCLDAGGQQQLLTRIVQNPHLIAEKVSSIQSYKQWNMSANASIPSVFNRLLGYQDTLEA